MILKEKGIVNNSRKKYWRSIKIIFSIVIVLLVLYFIYLQQIYRKVIVQTQITDTSVVETYRIADSKESMLLKVTDDYDMDERLYFLSYKYGKVKMQPLFTGEEGLKVIDDIVFHEWKNQNFVEIACSTNKGNGNVYLYQLKEGKLELVLLAQGAVDKNYDTTTNTVYENGRLFISFEESEDINMPNIILSGVEAIYGYNDPLDYSGDELLYQRNYIERTYKWNMEEKEYTDCEEERKLLQQVDGVYPVTY